MDISQKQYSWMGFNQIAKTYDTINRLTSFGIDRLWRSRLCSLLPRGRQMVALDLATGTGDVAIAMVKKNADLKKVYAVDPAVRMIDEGVYKIIEAKVDDKIEFKVGSALSIPLADKSVDVVTMAFGIRNVSDVGQAMHEIYRVLRPGGKVIILELSVPENAIIRALYLMYFRHILPLIGGIISGNKSAYVYLNQSVEKFPSGNAFLNYYRDSGFENEFFIPLTFGVASLYVGDKIEG